MSEHLRPTDAELEILAVLWERGPSTVREVHNALEGATVDVGRRYTTILKLMQIMLDKGLVGREEGSRAHVYEPLVTQESTRSHLLEELAERLFGGSTVGLALGALAARPATPAEMDQLRTMLGDLEGDAR